MDKLEAFKSLNKVFKDNGYSLFLVGGTVRDYLLGLPLIDFDVVTNAKPEEMKLFLKDADYTFSKFGSVKYHYLDKKFDITTLRKEEEYGDSRHPNIIVFCSSLEEDSKRRDFTINALYMNENERVIDFYNGEYDLKKHIIRMIGDPDIRIKEDPLRIIRAIRFKITLDFEIEESLLESIKRNKELLKNINKEKIEQDIKKCSNPNKLREYLNELEIL